MSFLSLGLTGGSIGNLVLMSSPNALIGDPYFEKLDSHFHGNDRSVDSRSPITVEDKFRGNDNFYIPLSYPSLIITC